MYSALQGVPMLFSIFHLFRFIVLNFCGTDNQPKFVICDIQMLNTLPKEHIINGLGEIIKHALIRDIEYFEYLENF